MRPTVLLSLLALTACVDKEPETEETAGIVLDADGDSYTVEDGDCDDNNSLVSPAAEELCDGFDNNCDGAVDEGVTTPFYADNDGDGFGDSASIEDACQQPSGHVPNGNDCDDANEDAFPGNPEVCDGVDNNCNGTADEGVGTAYFADTDEDGYGDPDAETIACAQPSGHVLDDTDCDDANAGAHPGAAEVCDEVDNNCDGNADEGVTSTFYVDTDGDLYGVADKTTEACTLPGGYTETAGDCDDSNAAINPSVSEVCDDIDNDCDGLTDDDDSSVAASTQSDWYADRDADGYGDSAASTLACDQPSGYTSDSTDCDDTDSTVYPSAAEVCDGQYNDCDDASYDASSAPDDELDGDGDRYVSCTYDSTTWVGDPLIRAGDDCDDDSAYVYPGATEHCDGIYNDCSDASYDASSAPDDELDDDGDGYVECAYSSTLWSGDSAVTDGDDCDDDDDTVYPSAAEICDGLYNNCNDADYDASSAPDDELDGDGDRYVSCAYDSATWAGDSAVTNGDDCDDASAYVYPGATEHCDGVYNDCDDADYAASGAPDDESDLDGDGYVECSFSTTVSWAGDSAVTGDDDCDDDQDATYPGAAEVCDGIYNNCSDTDYSATGAPDDESDLDGDGYVECAYSSAAWEGGSIDGGDDCDDNDPDAYPGAEEVCDGYFNDCDDPDYSASGAPDDEVDDDADGYVECDYDSAAWVGDSAVTDGDDCDDDDATSYPGAEELCDDVDNDCDGEADDGTLGLTADCPAYSCLEIIEEDSASVDDFYYIDPDGDGDETEVYCDMTTEGGGYTYLKLDYYAEAGSTSAYAYQAESLCDDHGMQLFVPRTSDHLQASLDIAADSSIGPGGSTSYMYILGIYPASRGRTCVRTGFNSSSCTGWGPDDGGPYFVGTTTGITEPNGDNDTTASMYYNWTTSGGSWVISWYNDIYYPGYGGRYFMCDVGDKWGDGVDRGD